MALLLFVTTNKLSPHLGINRVISFNLRTCGSRCSQCGQKHWMSNLNLSFFLNTMINSWQIALLVTFNPLFLFGTIVLVVMGARGWMAACKLDDHVLFQQDISCSLLLCCYLLRTVNMRKIQFPLSMRVKMLLIHFLQHYFFIGHPGIWTGKSPEFCCSTEYLEMIKEKQRLPKAMSDLPISYCNF